MNDGLRRHVESLHATTTLSLLIRAGSSARFFGWNAVLYRAYGNSRVYQVSP
ncbi:hypothetical protein COMA1_10199 [Candidatus Nitrospira nitrosa]|uniref:Uncharacterized protein n=1 Tax=Candidatus Nitrospira nitrosa TaxID=1742972 RepID=A0A0S4L767_9BACT|nr:hypothetical protein COMA1_10199 [Candidatus Nitrospira nitrosa]